MTHECGDHFVLIGEDDSMEKSDWKYLLLRFDFGMIRSWKCSLSRFLNLNNCVGTLWLAALRMYLIYLAFLFFYLFSVFCYHNWAIGLVSEGMDSPMTPRSGVRSMLVHHGHVFPYLCYFGYFYFSILFSLLICFLTLLFLLFWKNVEYEPPLFLPLEFNGDFMYFI